MTIGAAPMDLTILTLPSASVISSSDTFDSETRSISVLSLRKSMLFFSGNSGGPMAQPLV
jgi:hypothetical protein